MPSDVHLIGIGIQTSVGLHARAVVAAVRSRLNRFEESDGLRRLEDGSPIVVALLETLDFKKSSFERMKEMAAAAAQEALIPLMESGRWRHESQMPFFLSVPSVRPGLTEKSGPDLFKDVSAALSVAVYKQHTKVFDSGHTGGLAALEHAAKLIHDDVVEFCLVGGVESYRDIEGLEWLESQDRLKGEDTPSGFIPGEGAAVVLLCAGWVQRNLKLTSLGTITSVSCQDEPNPWYTDKPSTGQGLTGAIRTALDTGLPRSTSAETTWCDLNGENWRADEWLYAYLRTSKRHTSPLRLRHPADCLGDLGAATGTMLVGLAALDLMNWRTDARNALVFAASDTNPQRAAAMLVRSEERKQ